MSVQLLTEHHLEFLSLKGGCTGSSESTLVKNATLLEIECRGSNLIKYADSFFFHFQGGVLVDSFTVAGVILAILFFPIGILCCFLMMEKKCSNCGTVYH